MRSAKATSRPGSKRNSTSPGVKSPTAIVVEADLLSRHASTDRLQVGSPLANDAPPHDVQNPAAAGERLHRRIIADDPNWTLVAVPDLVELTIRHIVNNFASQSTCCFVIFYSASPQISHSVLKKNQFRFYSLKYYVL